MFIRLAKRHQPRLRYDGGDFAARQERVKLEVLATLGRFPERVDLNPELTNEWEDRGIRKQRFLIDVGPKIFAALQVNYPPASGGNCPALLCWHGHGAYGKDPVMGNLGADEIKAEVERGNYDYGHQMAENGFITYAIDWMGCGERNDQLSPHFLSTAAGRDWCNLYYMHASMFGMTPLSMNLTYGRAATDFVLTFPGVDPERLGVMGLSGGGTMTLWTALCDARFKAAEIICYSDLWALFGIRDINYCGSQIAPRFIERIDLPDLQGLLAPLPLLINVGANDRCFHPENAMHCFARVKAPYAAAGAVDRLHLDLFAGGHAWGGNKSESFFRTYLGA